jgi:hypothetical protein
MHGRVTLLLLVLLSSGCDGRAPSRPSGLNPSTGAGPSTGSPSAIFTVSGMVTERTAQGSRQPAAAIKVSFYSGSLTSCGGMPVARVTTAADGRYQLPVPRGGGCVEAQLRTEGDWGYGSPRKFVLIEGDIVVDFDLDP